MLLISCLVGVLLLASQCMGANRQPLSRTGSRHDAGVSSNNTPSPEDIAPPRTSRFDEILKDFDKPGSTFKYSFEQRRTDQPARRHQEEEYVGRNTRGSITTTTYLPQVKVKNESPRRGAIGLFQMPIIVVDDEGLNNDQIEPVPHSPRLLQYDNQLPNFLQPNWNTLSNQPTYKYIIPPVSETPEWANIGLLREERSDSEAQRQRSRYHYSSSTSETPKENTVHPKPKNQRQRISQQRSRTQVSRAPVTTQSPANNDDSQPNSTFNAPQSNRSRHRYNSAAVRITKKPLSTSSMISFA